MARAVTATRVAKPEKPQPLLLQVIFFPFRLAKQLIGGLIVAALISILIEWIGMHLWWPDQPDHAKQMLTAELHFLDQDIETSVFGLAPALIIKTAVSSAWHITFHSSFVITIQQWIHTPSRFSAANTFKKVLAATHHHTAAAGWIVLTLVLRATLFLLSMPLFFLCGFLGAIDGLIERELRRAEGDVEHSKLFSLFHSHLGLSFIMAWVIYLGWPFPISPTWPLTFFAVTFGAVVYGATATYKKFA